jgi:hypothetical protein
LEAIYSTLCLILITLHRMPERQFAIEKIMEIKITGSKCGKP